MRLRTFGGLWLEAPDAPTPGPRRLALLAVVSAAGAKGVSRERVIGLLWPETGEEQARHALSQAIYALRRGAERDLIAGTSQLRLDPSLTSDVGELRTALGAGDLETVARLYSGRFLEGFYLSGAPEFERWVDEERRDLEGEVVRALERLARQADEDGARPDAVRWWQRLTALDPLSARYAAGLMRALAATGDRSGALGRAKLYRETVRRELDAEPDPAIEKLERSLRSTPAAAPAVPQPEPLPQPPAVVPALPDPTALRARRRWQVPAALLAAGALVAFVVRAVGTRDSGALPFLAVGDVRIEGPGDTTSSGRVFRDMLATGLGGIAGLQVVANSRLVELMPRGPSPAPGAIGDAARRAGASEIIEGELSTEPAGLVLSLRRVALDGGVVRKGYVVRATDRFALVDSATAAIARDFALTPPVVTVTQRRTASAVAYALYDEGLRAYFGYDAPAAYRLMKAAFARDSSFGMAAYYVWHLSSIQGEGDIRSRIQPAVEELARKAIERERLLIQLSIAVEAWPTQVAAALAETLTVKYPQDPDGQALLGQVRHSEGDWAGAAAAFERAILLDSTAGALAGPYCRVCRVIALKTTAYLWGDSLAAAERTARRLIALRPDDQGPQGGPWNNLIEVLFRQGRRAEALDARVRDAIGTPSPHGLRRDLIRWGDYERADRELIADLASPEVAVREDAWWLLLLSLRDQGRLREADTLIHRWRVPNTSIDVPGGRRPAVDAALLGLERGRPEVSIRAHRENIAALSRREPSADRARNLAWQLALAGTAHAAAGDTAVVRRLADSLEAIGSASLFGGRDARLHHMLRGLLLQREGRHAEAVDAFRRSLYSVSDGYTRTNLMLARSLLALRRPAEAIAILRPAIRGGVDGSNTYVSRTELHEAMAEAFEQAGQRDSAVVHWRAVESAWRRADPQFAERYRRARAEGAGHGSPQ